MPKISSKHEKDQMVGNFFASWLNQQWDSDYVAEANLTEDEADQEVDVYLISTSNRYPKLYLQLITQEGTLLQISGELHTRAKREKLLEVNGPIINFDKLRWICNAFLKKINKYSPKVQKKLILIIWGNIGPLLNPDYANKQFQSLSQSGFQAVYQVQLPTDSATSNQPHTGQVIPIKSLPRPTYLKSSPQATLEKPLSTL